MGFLELGFKLLGDNPEYCSLYPVDNVKDYNKFIKNIQIIVILIL